MWPPIAHRRCDNPPPSVDKHCTRHVHSGKNMRSCQNTKVLPDGMLCYDFRVRSEVTSSIVLKTSSYILTAIPLQRQRSKPKPTKMEPKPGFEKDPSYTHDNTKTWIPCTRLLFRDICGIMSLKMFLKIILGQTAVELLTILHVISPLHSNVDSVLLG